MIRKTHFHNHQGQRFGWLTVQRRTIRRGDVRWICRCDCGQTFETFGSSLRNGRSKSCGCKRPSIAERLEKHSIPEPNSGCFIWLGSANKDGYGRVGIDGRTELATHIALRLVGKDVPHGMMACHTCDNPYCINPDHLYVGTRQDNMRDMARRRRGNLAKTHCPQGHPYSGDNLRINANGYRTCLACTQAASRKSYEARRANS